MIQIDKFFQPLTELGYDYYTGVPCSFFKSAINYAIANEKTEFAMAANEGSAVCMGAGAWLAGKKAVIMMQNSGFGNTVSPFTSLNYIYNIPAMVLISGRGYGVNDEPQHVLMGKNMTKIMDDMELKWAIIPEDENEWAVKVKEAEAYIEKTNQPFIWIAKKGCLSDFKGDGKLNPFPMTRFEAIQSVMDKIVTHDKNSAVFATTGMIGRESYEAKDRPQNFYMMGSMGHVGAMALGFCQAQPDTNTFALDGDGAMIMHAGILSTIGHYQPKKFFHVLIDNQAHESTGGQKTTSNTTDFCQWALASGYHKAIRVESLEELDKAWPEFIKADKPAMLHIMVSDKPKKDTPRITESHQAADISKNFRGAFVK